VTHLYTRPGNRVSVYWDPENKTIGKQAVESVVGPVESYPADVTNEQAEKIREEYAALLEQQTNRRTTNEL